MKLLGTLKYLFLVFLYSGIFFYNFTYTVPRLNLSMDTLMFLESKKKSKSKNKIFNNLQYEFINGKQVDFFLIRLS